jgi:hypothetical protein
MAWYEDLSPCGYFGEEACRVLRSVGWLELGRPFRTGPTERDIFDKLRALGSDPWAPVAFAGPHWCDLCQYGGASGVANMFIPGAGFLYVSPVLITHYMDAHRYRLPEEFCEAVRLCPAMRSRDYLQAILGNGGRQLRALWKPRLN